MPTENDEAAIPVPSLFTQIIVWAGVIIVVFAAFGLGLFLGMKI